MLIFTCANKPAVVNRIIHKNGILDTYTTVVRTETSKIVPNNSLAHTYYCREKDLLFN